MATRLALRQEFGRRTGLGRFGTVTSGTTTTLIQNTAPFRGPFPAERFPRGSPVRMQDVSATPDTAHNSYVDRYESSTGTLTITPPITPTPAASDTFEVWPPEVESVSYLDEALNRSLTRWCGRWVRTPLSLVWNPDFLVDITGWGTGGSPTETQVALPEGNMPEHVAGGAARIQNTIANDRLQQGQDMEAVPGETWYISVLARAASGTARLIARDITNGADITLNGDGSDVTNADWRHLENTFDIPTGCNAIRVWLTGVEATADHYWTHIIAYPVELRRFQLDSRVTITDDIADVLERRGDEPENFRYRPWALDGRRVGVEYEARRVTLELKNGTAGNRPLYVEEFRHYESLSTDPASTDAPDDFALAGMEYEYYKARVGQQRSKENLDKLADAKKLLDRQRLLAHGTRFVRR